jgi:hypothetical protein
MENELLTLDLRLGKAEAIGKRFVIHNGKTAVRGLLIPQKLHSQTRAQRRASHTHSFFYRTTGTSSFARTELRP